MPSSGPLPDFDPGAVVACLQRHGVRFVVIGGFAALAHGSPFPTEDIDITPEGSTENLERLSMALRELGARIRTASEPEGLPFNHDATSLAAAGAWNLVTAYGDLDVSLVPAGTQGFGDLARDAIEVTAFGVDIPIASLADVIRSKQAAGRAKDLRVLPTLRRLLAESGGLRAPRTHTAVREQPQADDRG